MMTPARGMLKNKNSYKKRNEMKVTNYSKRAKRLMIGDIIKATIQ